MRQQRAGRRQVVELVGDGARRLALGVEDVQPRPGEVRLALGDEVLDRAPLGEAEDDDEGSDTAHRRSGISPLEVAARAPRAGAPPAPFAGSETAAPAIIGRSEAPADLPSCESGCQTRRERDHHRDREQRGPRCRSAPPTRSSSTRTGPRRSSGPPTMAARPDSFDASPGRRPCRRGSAARNSARKRRLAADHGAQILLREVGPARTA